MYSLKLEDESKSTLCRGCLSTEREVQHISRHLIYLFHKLLNIQEKFCDLQMKLCWECTAMLKSVFKFQNKIQNVQFILQQPLYELKQLSISPLTNLTTMMKDYYDLKIEHVDLEVKDIIPEYKKVGIDKVKMEMLDEDSQSNLSNLVIDESMVDDTIIDDNVIDDIVSDNEVTNNESSNTEHGHGRGHRKRSDDTANQSIKKYESKAIVKFLNVNMDNLRKSVSKVHLTENEIEKLITEKRQCQRASTFVHKCELCPNTYKREVDLNRHMMYQHIKHNYPTKCLECSKTIISWDGMEKHWKKHNVYFKCGVCGWLTLSLASIGKHHLKDHTRVYSCSECAVTCRSLRTFSEHYKSLHERLICDHCGKGFLKKRALGAHIKRNHAPAICYICNKTYAHYHVLQNHYRMTHPDLMKTDNRTELAYCVECDKQFPTVYKYRRHLSTAAKHTPPKPVKVPCPECDKVFARKIRMTNHYNSVHRNTTKHRCDICNKTFCSAFSARTHRQHVHEKIPMPKNKMCDICGRGFSTNRILTNHKRTHTGERPHKCVYCPATFAQRTAMKTHEKSQHKREPTGQHWASQTLESLHDN